MDSERATDECRALSSLSPRFIANYNAVWLTVKLTLAYCDYNSHCFDVIIIRPTICALRFNLKCN